MYLRRWKKGYAPRANREGLVPKTPWFQIFNLSNWVNFCCLKPPPLLYFVTAALRNKYNSSRKVPHSDWWKLTSLSLLFASFLKKLLQYIISSVAQSCLTLCNSMDCSMPDFLPCPSPTPRVYSNSCPSSRWRHPAISASVVPFSCLQSLPASGAFPVSQFFASNGQSIGVSVSASVLLMNIQDWFPLVWTGWISLQSKGLSKVFSNTTVQKHYFFGIQLSL